MLELYQLRGCRYSLPRGAQRQCHQQATIHNQDLLRVRVCADEHVGSGRMAAGGGLPELPYSQPLTDFSVLRALQRQQPEPALAFRMGLTACALGLFSGRVLDLLFYRTLVLPPCESDRLHRPCFKV